MITLQINEMLWCWCLEFGSALLSSFSLCLTSSPFNGGIQNTHTSRKFRWEQRFDTSDAERSYLIVASLNASHIGPKKKYETETNKKGERDGVEKSGGRIKNIISVSRVLWSAVIQGVWRSGSDTLNWTRIKGRETEIQSGARMWTRANNEMERHEGRMKEWRPYRQ